VLSGGMAKANVKVEQANKLRTKMIKLKHKLRQAKSGNYCISASRMIHRTLAATSE